VRARGISVTGPHDPFEARPAAVHLNEAARLPRDFDIGFVALKVYDTAWATQLAGASRSVGLIMSKIGVAVWKPGQVERGMEKGQGKGHDVFRAGEHDGRVTARTTELAEVMSVIDGAQATDNLWGERWSKLCANAMGNPVQAMTGLGSLEIASSEGGRAITIHLAAESARVGLALGYRIPKFNGAAAEQWADAGRRETYETLDRMLTPATASTRNWRASMAQDVAKGRPTEIDYMNGHVIAQGRERGVATPVSAAVVEVMHEVERGDRKPVPQNVELALRRAGV
jgi:2-dehydropantoate 2-reductase